MCFEIGFDQKIDVIEIIEKEGHYSGTYCKKDLILDYGYNKNYACSNDLLETISVNKFLQDSKASFKEYKYKFVRINGKVSKISGNEVIEMAEYTKSDDVLNGYVNFNLSNSLKVLTKDDLSKYRIYDYIDVIGRVSEYQNGVIELMDVVLIPSGLYDSYSFEIINNNDNNNNQQNIKQRSRKNKHRKNNIFLSLYKWQMGSNKQ